MLKILYLYSSASSTAGSVQNKVTRQIRALNQAGAVCEGFFFSTDRVQESGDEKISFHEVERIQKGWFRSARQKAAYHRAVLNAVAGMKNRYDCVYYRYPGADISLLRLSRLFRKKIFFEHVTAETREIRMYARENRFRPNLSSLLGRIEFLWIPLLREKIYGREIRRNAAFGICNSEDIARYEQQYTGNHYPCLILGDAVQVDSFRLRSHPVQNDSFRMIFLKGASTSADFNGLDRLFKGMAGYKGDVKLHLYLFGKNLENEKEQIKQLGIEQMVTTGGYIHPSESDDLFDICQIGIGALAVHRKGIRSTTTMKSREYFARGIPFVYGHDDPDLDTPEASRFCMKVPVSDQDLDMDRIIRWYEDTFKQPGYTESMRKFAEEKLDYRVKMKKLVEFIRQNITTE